MTLELLCIGEAMAELRWNEKGEIAQGFAGDTFNTAIYASRLLSPGSVGFYSKVGTDPLSQSFTKMMAVEGLNPDLVGQHETRNIGIYSVSTDGKGERSFHYWRNQSAARCLFEDPADFGAMPSAKITYVSGITMAILNPAARVSLIAHLTALKGQSLIAYDSNYRPKLWEDQGAAQDTATQMWALADIALPSIDDEMDLFGLGSEEEVVDRFGQRSWHACAIKRGSRGPLTPDFNGVLPAFKPAEKVVDTTAAGDSFNGGFLAALVSGKLLAECLLAGHELASQVVGVRGAIAPRA